MNRSIIFSNAVAWTSFLWSTIAFANQQLTAPQVDFQAEILPILSDKCFACHGPDAAAGDTDLRLDSFAAASSDRGGFRAIDTENPEASSVLERIFSDDDPMPPVDAEKQLTAEEKLLLKQWVLLGGQYDQHWAFVPPVKVDQVGSEVIDSTNVIDGFIGAQLSKSGVAFTKEADRHILARRVALTLTGLPPEPEVLKTFLADSSEDAYRKFVDQMLEDPKFGEHFARFWLDSVRYGDTHGLHLDNRRGIYPYRDWVVRAFNDNLPLDKFVLWQLAGDYLPNPTLDQLVATGFVRLNPTTAEGGAIPDEFQAKNNFDRTETLGTVLLGMTFSCARCHTHKYDPITQTEYYELLAFFNSTAEGPMDGNAYAFGPTVSVPADHAAWVAWEQLSDQAKKVCDEAEAFLDGKEDMPKIDWGSLTPAEKLGKIAATDGPFANTALAESAAKLGEQLKRAEGTFTTTLVAKDLPNPRQTRVLRRGEYDLAVGEPLAPSVPAIMGELPEDAPKNRLGLAQWLIASENPLVTRVLANRLWQQVFGYGLVRTPEDFGVQGRRPTHPLLMDWLAVELRESGWDMKHLLRMMLNSRTFKQSSAVRSDLDDPENLLLGRGPRYRLDAEVLRDVGLWTSQLLDPSMGGEGVKPPQPPGMWEAMAHPASNTKQYVQDQGAKLYRRSLYVYWKRTSPHPMMTLFDAPDRESSCVRRSRSSTPLQSLGMLNETQRIEMARKFAERLMRESENDDQRLVQLFTLVACREPSSKELAACQRLLEQMRQRYSESPDDAVAFLRVGDVAWNERLSATEVAAWAQVCGIVLASDSAILMY